MAHKFYKINSRQAYRVFEQVHEISLRGLLESSQGRRLEADIVSEVLGDLANKTLFVIV
jgi:hypothetical protein